MIVKTIVIVAVSAGVSIASVLGILFVLDASPQSLLGEEHQKTKLAINQNLPPHVQEQHRIYKEVFETCETSPIVNDTESLLSCISSQMALRDESYVQLNIWWNTIPEYRDYHILYHDETQKCDDSLKEIFDECVGNADVYAREKSGFSNELLE